MNSEWLGGKFSKKKKKDFVSEELGINIPKIFETTEPLLVNVLANLFSVSVFI